MMKKLKKLLCYIIPLVLVIVIALTFVPRTFAVENYEKPDKNFNTSSDFNGQVVYAAGDTGAHSAAKEYKGGAIFLEPNTSMTMAGGNITGHSNTYGGAIYISNGATFTMKGGTITNNSATYGGAIYVESGGKCIIEAGAIKENKANHGAAVYIEEGGEFSASPTAEVADNEIEDSNFSLKVSEDTITIGDWYFSTIYDVKVHYLFMGSYPQTHVSKDYNAELYYALEEQAQLNPDGDRFMTTFDKNGSLKYWEYYNYNGETYVRGECTPYESGYTYKNTLEIFDNPYSARAGESVEEGTEWYKVEPIRWLVLNYDKWMAGEEEIEVISEEILLASQFAFTCDTMVWCDDVSFYNDYANTQWICEELWLRDEPYIKGLVGGFYQGLFSSNEKSLISKTSNPNSFDHFDFDYLDYGGDGVVYEYFLNPSEWTGDTTEDYLYLLTYYDIMNRLSAYGDIISRLSTCFMEASPTDFAIANGIPVDSTSRQVGSLGTSAMVPPASRYRVGTSPWWLRTSVGYPVVPVEDMGGGDYYMHICCVTSSGDEINKSLGDYNYFYNDFGSTHQSPPDDMLGVRPAMHLNIKP